MESSGTNRTKKDEAISSSDNVPVANRSLISKDERASNKFTDMNAA